MAGQVRVSISLYFGRGAKRCMPIIAAIHTSRAALPVCQYIILPLCSFVTPDVCVVGVLIPVGDWRALQGVENGRGDANETKL